MKRRDFLRSATATAVLPVLPPVLNSAAMASSSTAAPVPAAQIGWATLFARVNDRATPALIQKWMGVGPQQANALMSELLTRNIIHAPVAGTAASVQPMFPKTGIPGAAKTTGQIWRKTRDVFDVLTEDDESAQTDLTPQEDTDETA